ncbi:MAG: hypothetical protein AB7G75_12910 [Candidatus Binatia bacterium]
MGEYGFKYKVGDRVTHLGFLKPVRQSHVQQFEVVSQTLVAGPVSAQRIYYIRPVHRTTNHTGTFADTLRVQEENLTLWLDDDI